MFMFFYIVQKFCLSHIYVFVTLNKRHLDIE